MDNACLYQLTFTSYPKGSIDTYLFVSNEEAEQMRDSLLREELRKIFHDMMPEDDASGNLVIRLWPWPVERNKRFIEEDLEMGTVNHYIQNAWKIKALPVEGVTEADISARLEVARLRREREIQQEQ